jgi:hypothetical protein
MKTTFASSQTIWNIRILIVELDLLNYHVTLVEICQSQEMNDLFGEKCENMSICDEFHFLPECPTLDELRR